MIDHEKARSDTLRADLKQINVRLEMIDAAVKWWRDYLKLPLDDETKPLPDPVAIDKVCDLLRELLIEKIEETELLHLGVDYEPYGALADANVLADCPDIPWPGKVRMNIDFPKALVNAKQCRGCPFDVVYGEEQSW
jgi:hypothetical protein